MTKRVLIEVDVPRSAAPGLAYDFVREAVDAFRGELIPGDKFAEALHVVGYRLSDAAPNYPPKTSNPNAESLMKSAMSKCPSCRTHWRLRVGTFAHTNGATCSAQSERQALRDIASRGKDDAILKRQVTAIEGDM